MTQPAHGVTPHVDVSLDLDALEREGAPEPFAIQAGGRVYVFTDAMDLDWQDIMRALSDPPLFFRLTLPADDATQLLGTKLPVWKMRRLMNDYLRHYGMPTQPGESGALPG